MKHADFIARLKAECPLLKGRVYGAAELAVATPTTMQPPCAFVIPLRRKSEPNNLLGGFSQRITVKIGVVTVVRNFSDTRGDGAYAQMELVFDEIFNALCNWEAPNTSAPMEHVEGNQAGYDNLILRWNDVFQTQFYYRK